MPPKERQEGNRNHTSAWLCLLYSGSPAHKLRRTDILVTSPSMAWVVAAHNKYKEHEDHRCAFHLHHHSDKDTLDRKYPSQDVVGRPQLLDPQLDFVECGGDSE